MPESKSVDHTKMSKHLCNWAQCFVVMSVSIANPAFATLRCPQWSPLNLPAGTCTGRTRKTARYCATQVTQACLRSSDSSPSACASLNLADRSQVQLLPFAWPHTD